MVRVVPDDATALESEQALRLDDLSQQLAAAHALVDVTAGQRNGLAERVNELTAALAERDVTVGELSADLAAARALVRQYESSRAYRLYRRARGALG